MTGGSIGIEPIIKSFTRLVYIVSRLYTPNPVCFLDVHRLSYGYRGKDCRNNLYLLPTGEMVYFVAGVVVLYNVDDQMQRHYTGHTDDVKW